VLLAGLPAMVRPEPQRVLPVASPAPV